MDVEELTDLIEHARWMARWSNSSDRSLARYLLPLLPVGCYVCGGDL